MFRALSLQAVRRPISSLFLRRAATEGGIERAVTRMAPVARATFSSLLRQQETRQMNPLLRSARFEPLRTFFSTTPKAFSGENSHEEYEDDEDFQNLKPLSLQDAQIVVGEHVDFRIYQLLFGYVPELFLVLAKNPSTLQILHMSFVIAAKHTRWTQTNLQEDNKLNSGTLLAILFAVASAQKSIYLQVHIAILAKRFCCGDLELLHHVSHFEESILFSESEKNLIRYASSVTKSSAESPSAKDYEKVRTMFDQEAIIELSHLSGLVGWISSVARSLDLQVPPEYSAIKREIERFASTPLPLSQVNTSSAQVSARSNAATVEDLSKPVSSMLPTEQKPVIVGKKPQKNDDDEFDAFFDAKDQNSLREIKQQQLIKQLEALGVSQTSSSSQGGDGKKGHALEDVFTGPSSPTDSKSPIAPFAFVPPTHLDLIPQITSKFSNHYDSISQFLWSIPDDVNKVASPPQKHELVQLAQIQFGFVPNMLTTLGANGALLDSSLYLYGATFREKSVIPTSVKSIICLETSRSFKDRYLELLFSHLAHASHNIGLSKLAESRFSTQSITLQRAFDLARRASPEQSENTDRILEHMRQLCEGPVMLEILNTIGFSTYLHHLASGLRTLPDPILISTEQMLSSERSKRD